MASKNKATKELSDIPTSSKKMRRERKTVVPATRADARSHSKDKSPSPVVSSKEISSTNLEELEFTKDKLSREIDSIKHELSKLEKKDQKKIDVLNEKLSKLALDFYEVTLKIDQIKDHVQIPPDATDDEYLKQALHVSNRFLDTIHFKIVYRSRYQSYDAHKMSQLIKIEFQKNVVSSKKGSKSVEPIDLLAWTLRSEYNCIFINSVFNERLKKLQGQEDKEEKERIIFWIGVLIVHQLGHLMVRWSGSLYSPEEYMVGDTVEAGTYLEKNLFGYQICGIIDKIVEGEENFLSQNSCIKGVCVLDFDQDKLYYHEIKTKYINEMLDKNSKMPALPLNYGRYLDPKTINTDLFKTVWSIHDNNLDECRPLRGVRVEDDSIPLGQKYKIITNWCGTHKHR